MSSVLEKWIYDSTCDCESVVEFGAGFFEQLKHVNPSVKNKIGIEFSKKYIKNALYDDCIKIEGDMRDFESLVPDTFYDCALFVDSLEHLDKDDAIKLVNKCKDKFNRIAIMIPEGNHPQSKDVTGHNEHFLQTHRSVWQLSDFTKMGFSGILISDYHKESVNSKGAIFAIWFKNDGVV